MTTFDQRDAAARSILLDNDRGGYTIPTAGLYPYQWNWDSVFTALGFATFDQSRAWEEINSLFQAQWKNGMVPHIVFRRDDPDYFPGPNVWGTNEPGLKWPTSGISQPPVAATAIRWMLERGHDRQEAENHAQALIPKLNDWHKWWHEARDPEGLGIIAASHPWETGRDNLPDWDGPGKAVDTSDIGDYTRRDTGHVDASMRPTKADYDRYLALVKLGRDCNWDPAEIARKSPFWVADVGITAILVRAERDLLALCEYFQNAPLATLVKARIDRMEAGFERLWNARAQAYCSLDLRTGIHAQAPTSASFLCFYAGIASPDRRRQVLELAQRWSGEVAYMCPSFDPASAEFDPLRYWRGPVWPVINFLIATGLADAGHHDLAERIRSDTGRLMDQHGFAEYYSPLDGQPAGGSAFSWAAAMWLAWVSPTGE